MLFKLIKRILIKNNMFYKKAGYSHPFKFVSKLKKEFFWTKHYCAIFYLDYLNYTYGKNWRKSKKVYSWVKDSPSTTTLN